MEQASTDLYGDIFTQTLYMGLEQFSTIQPYQLSRLNCLENWIVWRVCRLWNEWHVWKAQSQEAPKLSTLFEKFDLFAKFEKFEIFEEVWNVTWTLLVTYYFSICTQIQYQIQIQRLKFDSNIDHVRVTNFCIKSYHIYQRMNNDDHYAWQTYTRMNNIISTMHEMASNRSSIYTFL